MGDRIKNNKWTPAEVANFCKTNKSLGEMYRIIIIGFTIYMNIILNQMIPKLTQIEKKLAR